MMSAYWIGFWNGVAWAALIAVIVGLIVASWKVIRKTGA